MMRIKSVISCLCVVSIAVVFANKSETPRDLILTHIVSNLLNGKQLLYTYIPFGSCACDHVTYEIHQSIG